MFYSILVQYFCSLLAFFINGTVALSLLPNDIGMSPPKFIQKIFLFVFVYTFCTLLLTSTKHARDAVYYDIVLSSTLTRSAYFSEKKKKKSRDLLSSLPFS